MNDPLEQWNLGQLIDALADCDPDRPILFDFADTFPVCVKDAPTAVRGIDSWRGVYAELALAYTTHYTAEKDVETWPKVGAFLTQLKRADGMVFTGYKGGDFLMGRETPLWVDNHGIASTTAVVGVRVTPHAVLIETGYCGTWD